MMLQRNPLYPAVTRASRLMILAGDPRALDIALGNRRQAERLTALRDRLRPSAQPPKTSDKGDISDLFHAQDFVSFDAGRRLNE